MPVGFFLLKYYNIVIFIVTGSASAVIADGQTIVQQIITQAEVPPVPPVKVYMGNYYLSHRKRLKSVQFSKVQRSSESQNRQKFQKPPAKIPASSKKRPQKIFFHHRANTSREY